MTVLVSGLLSNMRTKIESSTKVENLIVKPKVEEDLIEPKKNWAELNPDFDVPHREYEGDS